MRLLRIYVFTLLIIYLAIPQASAYLDGIEDGDNVNLDYVLTYEGGNPESGPGFETYVERGRIIDGFYEGLIGMRIGEQKDIVVPIGKGYPPGHKLGDKILYFDVTINQILDNVRGDNYIPPPVEYEPFQFGVQEDTGSAFEEFFSSPIVLIVTFVTIIGFLYIKSTGSSTTTVTNAKKSTKLTAKERLQKRMEEVDHSDFD